MTTSVSGTGTMSSAVPIVHYGKGAGGAVVDIDALVRGRALIQANSGGGKSWALRQLLEETYGKVQHLVIDPEGEFSTLREKFDYVVAAKQGADVEATPRTAKKLCRTLMETASSAVLDLYDLKPDERRDFVRLFLSELLALPKELRRPLLVVLDEAHTFAPEGAKSEATEAVVTLAAQGRKRGYALICATQRLSKLSKDVAAELNTKLIGRTGLDLDVRRAGDELGMDKETRAQLATLEAGTFYGFGAALPPGPPRLVRTGDVMTSHPEVGELAAPAPPPSKKVRALLEASFADLPKEAETEARSLDDLRKQNAELSRKLRAAERAQGQPTERIVTKPVIDTAAIDRAVHAAIAKWGALTVKALDGAVRPLARVQELLGDVVQGLDNVRWAWQNGDGTHTVAEIIAAPRVAFTPGREKTLRQPVNISPRKDDIPSDLPKGERLVLTAVAQNDGADRQQISILSGYKRSTRDAYIQRLSEKGFVETRGDTIYVTQEGIDALGSDFEPLPTGAALRDYWLGRLPEGERKCLAVLIDAYPDAMSRGALVAMVGYKRSTRDAYLQRLGTRKLVESVGAGEVQAAPMLFED